MKTAEEWIESNRLNGVSPDSAQLHVSEIKAIQKDAMAHAAQIAFNQQRHFTREQSVQCLVIHDAIMNEANKL